MTKKTKEALEPKFYLNDEGHFIIENYNQSRPFSNFFPGIAGIWGVPMWVFYVNRGQCIASFGIESKDKAIMEFQPANKAYRQTALNGFRTFIKVKTGRKEFYWEPFQRDIFGTDYKKSQKMSITAHDLTIEEVNKDLGLVVTVNYYTMPNEPYSALFRKVTIKNISKNNVSIEMIDGLPTIVSYGMKDWLNKNLARTIEAWIKVRNISKKAPFYQLCVEVSDKPEVIHTKEGNFFFSFNPQAKGDKALDVIVEASKVFGENTSFTSPTQFLQGSFNFPAIQQTSNRTPSAMSHFKGNLKDGSEAQIVSVFGCTYKEDQVNDIVAKVTVQDFADKKAFQNKKVVDGVKNYAFTCSSSQEFDLYSQHTFLDNILRGGLPVSLKTSDGNVAFNVYSRKHGDLERDYNYFFVSPTYYSQGNGNYRDVNQNRRNDIWFNSDVGDNNIIAFFNLSQADGYNPLVVKGATFAIENVSKSEYLIRSKVIKSKDKEKVREYFKSEFMPGALLEFIMHNEIELKCDIKEFLVKVLEICCKSELAEHGEGFWCDHWTYNLDLLESYLGFYPEYLKNILLDKRVFNFYHDSHYVLPRDQRYVNTEKGVRQYESVFNGSKDIDAQAGGNRLRINEGKGSIYYTNLIEKLVCIIANKVATLDPSGIGIEMEADKPGWYDALNGLPGLLGSSSSETFELKRIAMFLMNALDKLGLEDSYQVNIFQELHKFVLDLTNVLRSEKSALSYWDKSNEVKEKYRAKIIKGIKGSICKLSVADIRDFLRLVVSRTDKAINAAKDSNGLLATYFYHEVKEYESLGSKKSPISFVKPKSFKKHVLPSFLEGYVHALKVQTDKTKALNIYQEVRSNDLFDKKLGMYKVNADISSQTEEIGRASVFPASWLENESVWLHMEYKLMLEILRSGLYEEFYENFRKVFVPFLNPKQYGRSVLENSSFIVSSAHEDKSLHGQGFVARLSGSTAEFLHIWLIMNIGEKPFDLDVKGELILTFNPILKEWLFTRSEKKVLYLDGEQVVDITLPRDTYSFNFLGSILVVYHNPKRLDTFGTNAAKISEIHLQYADKKDPAIIKAASIGIPYAKDVRDKKVKRIDVFFNS